MNDRALYFPYIRVPENEWFVRSLLYWDEVGAIVPYEYVHKPEVLGPYMVRLLHAGLVKQVIPGQYTYRAPEFTRAFLAFVDASKRSARPRSRSPAAISWARIHMEKLADVGDGLVARSLARRVEYPWYEVESRTASSFMAYLASVIGQTDDPGYIPITDSAETLTAFARPAAPEPIADKLNDLRAAILEQTLPAPSEQIDPDELVDFKANYGHLLKRFRARVEAVTASAAAITDSESRRVNLQAQTADMQSEIEEIRRRMSERRWPRITFGTVCSLVASALPGYQTVVERDLSSALLTGVGLLAAVYSAVASVPRPREVLRGPLAYAALARERFA
jgi:hypothetical protein